MTDYEISFWAPGRPAPQGSKKHIGGGRLVEMSKKVKPWRQAVSRAAIAAQARLGEWEPLDGPLTVLFEFWMPRPVSHPKTKRTWPVGPPDLDKLCRSTFDALTSSGTIHDDSRAIELVARKFFVPTDERHALEGDSAQPGALIRVGHYPTDATPPTGAARTLEDATAALLAAGWTDEDIASVLASRL